MRKPTIVVLPALMCAIWLAGVAFVMFGTNPAQAQSAAPTPTVPSWNKPNLHLYFVDGSGQPVTGLVTRLYDVKKAANDPLNPDKTQLIKLWEGVTNGQGRAEFDATTIVCDRMYYLEVREADGTVVLPFDPNGTPRPATGQPLNPKIAQMVILSLNKGSIIYVSKWKVQPLIEPGTSRRALSWPKETWEYWPEGNSNLLELPQVTNTTGGNFIITEAVQKGWAGNTPVPAAATATANAIQYGYTPVPNSATPAPTCRYCNQPTDNPETLAAYMTGSGRGGGGKLTPTPYPPGVLTQRAEHAITDVVQTSPNATVLNPKVSPEPLEMGVATVVGKTTTTTSTQVGEDFPWLAIIIFLAGLVIAVFVVWKLMRRK